MGGPAENRSSAYCAQRDSVDYLECRGILGPSLPPIIESCGGDVCMPEPFLHLSNNRLRNGQNIFLPHGDFVRTSRPQGPELNGMYRNGRRRMIVCLSMRRSRDLNGE